MGCFIHNALARMICTEMCEPACSVANLLGEFALCCSLDCLASVDATRGHFPGHTASYIAILLDEQHRRRIEERQDTDTGTGRDHTIDGRPAIREFDEILIERYPFVLIDQFGR